MIAGVGMDLVSLADFEQLLEPGSAFMTGTFTAAELSDHTATPVPQRLAARYAAKEAFLKAWSVARAGSPPALPSLDMREIEVRSDRWGRPELCVRGKAAAAVAESLGPLRVHLSLSHEPATAGAVVVLERVS